MKKFLCSILCWLLAAYGLFAQNETPQKLKVYIDCGIYYCDMDYIRTEINIVDYMRDHTAADVHVLITHQPTGSSGTKYQMIFYGLKRFKHNTDSLNFFVDRNATDFERREALVNYIKAGLAPFIAKTQQAGNMKIDMRYDNAGKDSVKMESMTRDPWNYWVFRLNGNLYVNADQVYKTYDLGAGISARRTTEKLKIYFYARGGSETSKYDYDTDTGPVKVKVFNKEYFFDHYIAKSIDPHWSYGYELYCQNSTFSNYKANAYLLPQAEYSFFPVKDVNNKYVAFRYGIGVQYNSYYDSTIYNKTSEWLTGHKATFTVEFNQKWGSIASSITYFNYFSNWKFYKLQLNNYADVRITGGLSIFMYMSAEIAHDQIYLSKEGATEQEVLTRRKELESSYTIYTSIGITYRFGSKLNNFINPRFESRFF